MLKGINYLTAIVKVTYDKSVDCLGYYLNGPQDTIVVRSQSPDFNLEDVSDDLDHYKDIIKVDKYVNEDKHKRLFQPVSLIQEYQAFFDKPTHVVDNIYIGSAFNAASYYDLRELDIKVIINVTKEISHYYPNKFIYLNYDVYDNNEDSIYEHLDKAYHDILDHQKETCGNILIHCYMGSSRSASVVLYYLMKTKKNSKNEYLSHEEALTFLKNKRPIVNPTFRFTKDLARSVMFDVGDNLNSLNN